MNEVMRFRPALLLLFLAGIGLSSHADDKRFLQGLGDPHYHHFTSEHIGRSFHIYVMLPNGYDASRDKRYPTIYLLDGGALFPPLVGYYNYLRFGEEIPESIIVGISYGASTFREGNYRSSDYTAPSIERDFWGGAKHFQAFLAKELMPFIEGKYASRGDRRILFGQSLGGQFVLYTAQTDPDLFWGHIACNPALHRNLDFFLDAAPHDPGKSKLFVANGELNDDRFQVPAKEWEKFWTTADPPPWILKVIEIPGHTHMSAPPEAFRLGMNWLFESERDTDD